MKTKDGFKKAEILEFIADEISGVDVPAQQPAVVVMTKRATNEVPPVEEPQAAEEVSMSDELTKKVEELEGQVEDLTKKLEKSASLLGLNDAQREFHKGLADEAAEKFVSATSDERDVMIKAAADADETVVIGDTEMKKSVLGDEAFAIIKQQAADLEKAQKDVEEATAKVVQEQLNKRAGELKHLPGTDEAKITLLKSVDSIEDETIRKSVLEVIKASNEDMAKAFEEKAHQAPEDAGTPEVQLGAMVKKYSEDNKVSEVEAFSKVLDTPEGAELYGKTQE